MSAPESTQSRGFLRPSFWFVYAVLGIVAVPWYWGGGGMVVVFGFPLWVVVSLSASFLASIYTAYIIQKNWPSEEEEDRKS